MYALEYVDIYAIDNVVGSNSRTVSPKQHEQNNIKIEDTKIDD